MAFANRIRLPFYLSKPQFPVDEEVYLKANGRRQVLKSIVSKEYEGKTDWMPKQLHERLAIALRHDSVNVEGADVTAGIRVTGAYDIEWIDFLNYPIAPAKFKAFHEAFTARNTKCEICEPVFNTLDAVDDVLNGILVPGVEYMYDVTVNDSICCENPVFSIVSFDSTYIQSVSIDAATGIVTFEVKDVTVANASLFVYKVVCGESEDSAVVYGSIEGSGEELCPMIPDLWADVPADGDNVTANWLPSVPPPALGYACYTYLEDGGTPILIDFTITFDTFLVLPHLDPGNYTFHVYCLCGEDNISNGRSIGISIPEPEAPAGNDSMSIQVKPVSTVNGPNLDWTVQAKITSPGGVTADENIVITGQLHLFDENGDQLLNYTVTLLAGNNTDSSAVVGSTTENGIGNLENAENTPANVTGSDTNEYYIILILA